MSDVKKDHSIGAGTGAVGGAVAGAAAGSVAGPVGTALASLVLDRGWVRRVRGSRAIVVTPVGRVALRKAFNVRWEGRS